MKTSELIKFSLNNIKKEKAKNCVLFLVILVVECFIMFFLLLSANINNNLNRACTQTIKENGLQIDCYRDWDIMHDELCEIIEISNKKYSSTISGYKNGIQLIDFQNINIPYDGEINPIDFQTNPYALINKEYKDDYAIGDTFKTRDVEFIVKGYMSEEYTILADIRYFDSNIQPLNNITISYNYNVKDNTSKVIKYYNKLVKQLQKKFPITDTNSKSIYHFTLDSINKTKNLSMIIISLIIVLAITMLILSLGTIGNALRIKIEENLYDIGLLKVCGITNKDLYKIYLYELIIIMISAMLFATAIILSLKQFISRVSYLYAETMTNIFIDGLILAKNSYVVDWYLPILTLAITIIFTLVYSNLKLKKVLNVETKTLIERGVNNEE